MTVLRRIIRLARDDHAAKRLLARIAEALDADPAMFRKSARELGGTYVSGSQPLDIDMSRALERVSDRNVRARLEDLLLALRRRERSH